MRRTSACSAGLGVNDGLKSGINKTEPLEGDIRDGSRLWRYLYNDGIQPIVTNTSSMSKRAGDSGGVPVSTKYAGITMRDMWKMNDTTHLHGSRLWRYLMNYQNGETETHFFGKVLYGGYLTISQKQDIATHEEVGICKRDVKTGYNEYTHVGSRHYWQLSNYPTVTRHGTPCNTNGSVFFIEQKSGIQGLHLSRDNTASWYGSRYHSNF